MNFNSPARILLLDLGHPMTKNTMTAIKLSLQNVLSLLYSFFENFNCNTIFGVSLLNSTHYMFVSFENFKKNYNFIMKKLNSLDKSQSSEKVTIQQYKYLIQLSIESVLNELGKRNLGSFAEISINKEKSLEINIITKKTASIVGKILVEVLNKLGEKHFQISAQCFKIIQIIDDKEQDSFKFLHTNRVIEWTTCEENSVDFDSLFKNWMLKSDHEEGQLGIILSEEINLILRCDLVIFVINPYYSSNPKITGELKPKNNLNVLHRILVADMCPSLSYGITYKAIPTRSANVDWNELRVNGFIFTELCQQLNVTSQGLITKATSDHEINSYYFITSDGTSLFIKNLVSHEFFFPQDVKGPRPDLKINPEAALIVKSCLENINVLDKFSPFHFSSGLYNFLKSYTMRPEKKLHFLEHIDPELKSFDITLPRKLKKRRYSNQQIKYNQILKTEEIVSKYNQIKKQKFNSEFESTNTHPALLPQDVINKYKKNYYSKL